MAYVMKKIGNDTRADQIINEHLTSPFRKAWIEVGEEKMVMPVCFEKYAERIRNFTIYDDDVFVLGHAKTGTTWATEMVWLLVNNLDYEAASSVGDHIRFFEASTMHDFEQLNTLTSRFSGNLFELMENSKRPRCLKSHLFWSLLPEQTKTKNPKMIVILRDPGDTCVSHYFYAKSIGNYNGSFEDFCELYLAEREPLGPFWKHVLGYWKERDRSNICFIKFKEMKSDLPETIRKVADFLGKSYSDEEVATLASHLNIENMKKNSAVNHVESGKILRESAGIKAEGTDFIRKGNVGEYKTKMSPEMVRRFDAWTKQHLQGTGLEF